MMTLPAHALLPPPLAGEGWGGGCVRLRLFQHALRFVITSDCEAKNAIAFDASNASRVARHVFAQVLSAIDSTIRIAA